ncbi:MAG: trypsin-like peptidase domain-containing protein [Pseudomonadota bacterium]
MQSLKSTADFVLRCIIIGLAVACVIILMRPSLLHSPASHAAGQQSFASAVAQSAAGVVNIYTTRVVAQTDADSQQTTYSQQNNLGSGVIIDAAGYVVTNYHVIAGSKARRVQLADGRVTRPQVIGFDVDTDLALLKIDLPDLQPVTLGRSDQMQIGDVVLAIGNPYGLSQTVTQGIISATGRGLLGLTTFENYIQTDAAINSGNSGGALVNTRGELIGINTAVISREVNIQGISFAIPVNLVSGVVRALREDGRVLRGWLGMEMQPLSEEDWARIGLPPGSGIMLRAVQHQGPAWQAGIRPGDILLTINGEQIETNQQALLKVASYEPGTQLKLAYWRKGEFSNVDAVAGDRSLSTGSTANRVPVVPVR